MEAAYAKAGGAGTLRGAAEKGRQSFVRLLESHSPAPTYDWEHSVLERHVPMRPPVVVQASFLNVTMWNRLKLKRRFLRSD